MPWDTCFSHFVEVRVKMQTSAHIKGNSLMNLHTVLITHLQQPISIYQSCFIYTPTAALGFFLGVFFIFFRKVTRPVQLILAWFSPRSPNVRICHICSFFFFLICTVWEMQTSWHAFFRNKGSFLPNHNITITQFWHWYSTVIKCSIHVQIYPVIPLIFLSFLIQNSVKDHALRCLVSLI